MDITKLKATDSAPIHLKNAAGELLYDGEKPVCIIVYGPGSKAYGVVEARQSARAIKRMQDNDGKITVAPHETRVTETAEDLASITIAFENLQYDKKQGAELFQAVYADQQLGFITKQVTKFIADWSNFTPGSSVS